MKGKILIVYAHDIGYPPRVTNDDMLYCFERYSGVLCYYVNVAFGIPQYLKDVSFDLIIFHDLFLSKRSLTKRFKKIYENSLILKDFDGYKIATAQDEFLHSRRLCELINEFNIMHVFSVSPPSEWGKIYEGINRGKIKLDNILCGYVEKKHLEKIHEWQKTIHKRKIDIGYRASFPRFSLGYFNYLKYKIGEIVKERAKKFSLTVDISNEFNDTLLGIKWFKFLLKCKYILGIEGGASILDKDGSIQKSVFNYISRCPKSDFKEIENACFKGVDGQFNYRMITPRHFEACMTKTCQILFEGNYSGILKPGKHYLEIKKDFSNLDEVLTVVKKDSRRKKIINQAYKDIVKSDKYSYGKFVQMILHKSLGKRYTWENITINERRIYSKNKIREKLLWMLIPGKSFIVMAVINFVPKNILYKLISIFT